MKDSSHEHPANRFDRPDEDRVVMRADGIAHAGADRRGALDLGRDGSQHRRYHALFEDLLN